MECPTDGATLVMSERSGIEIDYCPTCRGVWLDRGELDKIIERSYAQAAPPAPPPQQQYQQRDHGYQKDTSRAIPASARRVGSARSSTEPSGAASQWGAASPVRSHDQPPPAELLHVVAKDLTGFLVRVEVERVPAVGHLSRAVGASRGPQQPATRVSGRDRIALGEHRWPRLGAGVVAARLPGGLAVEEIDRLAASVEQHRSVVAGTHDDPGTRPCRCSGDVAACSLGESAAGDSEASEASASVAGSGRSLRNPPAAGAARSRPRRIMARFCPTPASGQPPPGERPWAAWSTSRSRAPSPSAASWCCASGTRTVDRPCWSCGRTACS